MPPTPDSPVTGSVTDVIDTLVPSALSALQMTGGSLGYRQTQALQLAHEDEQDYKDREYVKDMLYGAETAAGEGLLAEVQKIRPNDTFMIDYSDHTATHSGEEPRLIWHIKPIDGIQNFEHGVGTYTVALSAVDPITNRTRFTSIYAPNLERLWWTDKNRAYRKQGRRSRAEPLVPYRLSKLTVIGTNYPRDRALRHAYLGLLPEITDRFRHLRMLGSGTLQGVMMAEARMSALIEFDVKPSSYLPTRELVRLSDGLSELLTLPDGSTALVAARQARDFDLLVKQIQRLQ